MQPVMAHFEPYSGRCSRKRVPGAPLCISRYSKLPVQSPIKNEICMAKDYFAAPQADVTTMTVKYDILK